jgi:hypothetical protein
VLWSGHTDYVPHGDTAAVTTSAYSPAESSVPDTVTTSVAPNADYSFTQTAIPGTATAASVSVHLTWTGPSRFAADASNSVQLTGDCYAVVTPAEPSVSTPNCIDTTLTVTLPKTTGVTYNASGPLKLAPGESVTITPAADKGFVLAAGSHPYTISDSFDVTKCQVTNPGPSPLVPTHPTVTSPNCSHPDVTVTLPVTPHITYRASGSLKLRPHKSLSVTPIADEGYVLATGSGPYTVTNTFDTQQCQATNAPPVNDRPNASVVSQRAAPVTLPARAALSSAPGLATTGSPLVIPAILSALLVSVGCLILCSARVGAGKGVKINGE